MIIDSRRYVARKNPRSDHLAKFVVVDQTGDAEMGNWIIAECEWLENAERIAYMLETQEKSGRVVRPPPDF